MKDIYINFRDLNEETQREILEAAADEIRSDADEVREIISTYGRSQLKQIIEERAERKIYEYNFIFNV